MRFLLLLFVAIVYLTACKKSHFPNSPEQNHHADSLPCGCNDPVAYNYSSAFTCLDTLQCYYPTNRLSGIFAGVYHSVEYGPDEVIWNSATYPDTLTIVKATNHLARMYEGNSTNYFQTLYVEKIGDDVKFFVGDQTSTWQGLLTNDTIGYHYSSYPVWGHTEVYFKGTRIQ